MLIAARRQRGVTLVELIVTLAVMALLMFAVVPDLTGIMANARLRSAAEATSAGLQRARMEAMRTNTNVTFWMTTSNASYALDNSCALSSSGMSWVVSLNDPTGACAGNVSDTAAPMIKLKHDAGEAAQTVAVAGKQGDRATTASDVGFDGFGRISGGLLRYIDFTHTHTEARALRIEMTNSGVIRVCEPGIAAASTDPRRCLYL